VRTASWSWGGRLRNDCLHAQELATTVIRDGIGANEDHFEHA